MLYLEFSRWWKENNPCATLVFKPKFVNLMHSSKESLKYPIARASMKGSNSQNETIEITELVSLNPTSR
jgi:phenolic acid decarboxylase